MYTFGPSELQAVSIFITLSSTSSEGVMEEASFIPLNLVVNLLKTGLAEASHDNPLTQPRCSLPNMTLTRSFGDISNVLFGFCNIST